MKDSKFRHSCVAQQVAQTVVKILDWKWKQHFSPFDFISEQQSELKRFKFIHEISIKALVLWKIWNLSRNVLSFYAYVVVFDWGDAVVTCSGQYDMAKFIVTTSIRDIEDITSSEQW